MNASHLRTSRPNATACPKPPNTHQHKSCRITLSKTPVRSLGDSNWAALAKNANFRPAAMAALCSVSLRQLERYFASNMNQTPGAWTRELRLRIAKQLISHGWSGKSIASELSFSDTAHFCREFKRRYGVTPQSWIHTRTLERTSARSEMS